MSIDTSNSITKSFKSFFLGTFFSRISGLLRDVLTAFFFGVSPHIAAFMVAYRFANLFRRLIGEASFQAGFVPYYENLRLEGSKKGAFFYRDLFFSVVVFLAVLITISQIALFSFAKFNSNKEIISLTQIMLFGLIFICLYALNSSFLQCHRSYFLPSIAPMAFNLIWIFSCIIFRNLIDEKFVYVLATSIVFAFFFQYFTTAFSSFKIISKDLKISEILKPKLFTSDIKKLIKPIFLSILGIGAVQINSALDAAFAIFAEKSGPAYLWYAIRVYQLPLALFGIAISSAILPPLARAYKLDDFQNFKRFLNLAFLKSFSLMLISSFALILIGPSLINLLFARGAFKLDAIINTSYSLFGYSIGLLFATFVMIISQAFYAKKEYFIPTIASISSVFFNILLNSIFIFVFHMKSASVAIATSLSAILNFLILNYFLKKKFTKFGTSENLTNFEKIYEKDIFKKFFKIFISLICASGFTILIGYFIKNPSIYFLLNKDFVFPTSFLDKLYSFFIISTIYLTSTFFFAYIFKAKEILDLNFLKNISKKSLT
ncbi:MAG: Lipid II flippase MurJ [Candidatus Anoxychlamydiales bacterium]|nr:Lipid II flippase MurJ [Candidatus Anoxychlamydiales bacterium]